MTTASQLVPGDLVQIGPDSAVFLAQLQHPVYPYLRLVIWRSADGTLCPDALAPGQDCGTAVTSSPADRAERLLDAIDFDWAESIADAPDLAMRVLGRPAGQRHQEATDA